jgi:hypothetical protein
VIFDVDDLIFDPDIASEIPALQILPPAEAEGWLYGVRRYRTTMEHCDGYVGSTPQLVRHAQAVTDLPAARFDNGVGMLLARLSDRALAKRRQSGPLRIGYLSGTITHDRDWFYVEPAIVETLHRHPEIELWLGGHLPESAALEPFGKRVKRIPFRPWTELPKLLHQLDINLAPVEPMSRFNEAKSAIKWLEAALAATPTVASSTEPFREAIEHGVSGLLAENMDEWCTALDRLITDRGVRRLMGERARREALLRWSPHLQGQRFLDVLREAQEWPALAAARPSNGWEPAIADEPFEPIPLDRYTASRAAGLAEATDRRRERASWMIARGRRSIRERGPAATARVAVSRGGHAAVRAPRVAAQRIRRGRPAELVRYTRRMVHDEGASHTASRALRFTTVRSRSFGRSVRYWPGIAQVLAVVQKFRRSIDKNGVGGTIDLARPIARHVVLHSYSLIRLRAHILVRRVLGLFRR